jgi:hypothetical protein
MKFGSMKMKTAAQNSFLAFVCLAVTMGCSFSSSSNENANVNNAVANNSNDNTFALAPEGGGGDARAADAERQIADLYKQHDANKSPFFQTTDRGRVDAFFTKPTADLIWKDANESKGEIGAIDFDPLYATQDLDKKNFSIGKASLNGDTATVVVSYSNSGAKMRITYVMKMQDGSWKIDDIKYGEGFTLLTVLKETYGSGKNNAPPVTNVSGEFKGTYRVGDTTCTVKPVKQAFEIRWAKGKGSEFFFFKEGGNIFESEPDKNGGRNEFRFDDDKYNTGTFYRPDGKTFPVSRAK